VKHKTQNYNLLVENWIPILRTDGTPGRVGITPALLEASHIRQIAASDPMGNWAELRMLNRRGRIPLLGRCDFRCALPGVFRTYREAS
jgi:hypothetical protein